MAEIKLLSELKVMPSYDRESFLIDYPHHLAASNKAKKLKKLLINFCFLEAKLAFNELPSLVTDYDLIRELIQKRNPFTPKDEEIIKGIGLIQKSLQQSAHILETDPTQLPGQLLARLETLNNPVIQSLLEGAKACQGYPWLRPLYVHVSTPNDPLVHTIVTGYKTFFLAMSGDGKSILTADGEVGAFKLWDATSKKLLKTLEMQATWMAVRMLLLLNSFHYSELVETITDEDLKECTTIEALAISPDGKWALSGLHTGSIFLPGCSSALASSIQPQGGVVELWNVLAEESVLAIPVVLGGEERITSVALGVNGFQGLIGTSRGRLIACNFRKKLKWERGVDFFDEAQTFEGEAERLSDWATEIPIQLSVHIDSVALSDDGRWAVAASGKVVKVWDLQRNKLHRTIPPNRLPEEEFMVKLLNVTPEGHLILGFKGGRFCEFDLEGDSTQRFFLGTQYLFDAFCPQSVREMPIQLPQDAFSVAISADCRWAVFTDNVEQAEQGVLKVWDLSIARQAIL